MHGHSIFPMPAHFNRARGRVLTLHQFLATERLGITNSDGQLPKPPSKSALSAKRWFKPLERHFGSIPICPLKDNLANWEA